MADLRCTCVPINASANPLPCPVHSGVMPRCAACGTFFMGEHRCMPVGGGVHRIDVVPHGVAVEPPAPAALPELKAKMLRIFREAGIRQVPVEQIPDLIEEIARMTWAEADTEKAALAQRVAELEAEVAVCVEEAKQARAELEP